MMANSDKYPPLCIILRDDVSSNSMPHQNELATLSNSPHTPPYSDGADISSNFALNAPSTGAREATPRVLELSGIPYCSDPLGLQSAYNYAITSPHRQQASDQVHALSDRLQSLQAGATYSPGRQTSQGDPHAVNTQSPVIRNSTLIYSEALPFIPNLSCTDNDEVFINPHESTPMNTAHQLNTVSTHPARLSRHDLTHTISASTQPSCNNASMSLSQQFLSQPVPSSNAHFSRDIYIYTK